MTIDLPRMSRQASARKRIPDTTMFLLEQLFSPNPPTDPFKRAASHIDGAASVVVGIASNESMRTGKMVSIDELSPLPTKN